MCPIAPPDATDAEFREPPPWRLGRSIVLVGLMGAGKTSIGKRLARALGAAFSDADEEIVTAAGLSIPDIFALYGEARFRELEREAMADLLAGPASVLAPGGGWAAQPGNLEAGKARGLIVYLMVPAATALARALEGTERPLLAGGEGLARMTALLLERESSYRKADVTVDNSGDDPAIAATEIVRWIRRRGAG